jgi:hypothetical protein
MAVIIALWAQAAYIAKSPAALATPRFILNIFFRPLCQQQWLLMDIAQQFQQVTIRFNFCLFIPSTKQLVVQTMPAVALLHVNPS